jgi:hypothetical protein
VLENDAAATRRVSYEEAASYAGEGARSLAGIGNENAAGNANGIGSVGGSHVPGRRIVVHGSSGACPKLPRIPLSEPTGAAGYDGAETSGPHGESSVGVGMRLLLGEFDIQFGHWSGRQYQSNGENRLVILVASFGAIGSVTSRDIARASSLSVWIAILRPIAASSA